MSDVKISVKTEWHVWWSVYGHALASPDGSNGRVGASFNEDGYTGHESPELERAMAHCWDANRPLAADEIRTGEGEVCEMKLSRCGTFAFIKPKNGVAADYSTASSAHYGGVYQNPERLTAFFENHQPKPPTKWECDLVAGEALSIRTGKGGSCVVLEWGELRASTVSLRDVFLTPAHALELAAALTRFANEIEGES